MRFLLAKHKKTPWAKSPRSFTFLKYTCIDCQAELIHKIKAEHDYQITVDKDATCTTDGEHTKECTNCGNKITEKIEAHHKWEEEIEIIKDKMNIDNYSQYDENYIYFLIETYFEDFKNKQIVKEIKESPFYIELSEKISELDSKKNKFKKKKDLKKFMNKEL